MKIKRILSGALATAVAVTSLGLATLTASGAGVTKTYTYGDATVTLYDDGLLEFKGGKGTDLAKGNDQPWKDDRASVKKLRVDCEYFGAFAGGYFSSSLTEIEVTSNCTGLGKGAFTGNSVLEKVTLAETITSIPDQTFAGSGAKKPTIEIKSPKISYGNIVFGNQGLASTKFYGTIIVYSQEAYDATKKAAPYATITLKEIEYDYKALDDAIAKADALKKEEYTEDSYKKLEEALTAGKALKDSAKSQDEIEKAAQAIEDAITGLEKAVDPKDVATVKLIAQRDQWWLEYSTVFTADKSGDYVITLKDSTNGSQHTIGDSAFKNLGYFEYSPKADYVGKTCKIDINSIDVKTKDGETYRVYLTGMYENRNPSNNPGGSNGLPNIYNDWGKTSGLVAVSEDGKAQFRGGGSVSFYVDDVKTTIDQMDYNVTIKMDDYVEPKEPESPEGAIKTNLYFANKGDWPVLNIPGYFTEDGEYNVELWYRDGTGQVAGLESPGVFVIDFIDAAKTCPNLRVKFKSMTIDGQAVEVDESKLIFGDLEEDNDNLRLEIYNKYGETKDNPPLDPATIKIDRGQKMVITLDVRTTDLSGLKAAIKAADEVDTTKYTDDSVATLTEAVKTGKSVLETLESTQEQIDNAANAINDAIKGLVQLVVTDFTALNDAIKEAEALTADKYTEDSYAKLTAAVETGKTVAANKEATQVDVDSATTAIKDAIAALVKVSKGNDVSGTVTTPGTDAEVTVTVATADGETVAEATAANGEYTIPELEDGEYVITFAAEGYVTRSYTATVTNGEIDIEAELHAVGDINGDGIITTVDVGLANAHAKATKTLEGYDFEVAEVSGDDIITTVDVGMINSTAKRV